MVFSTVNSLNVYPAIPILKVLVALSTDTVIPWEVYKEEAPAARTPAPANFKNPRREFII
jgi:hypothetical protein